MVIDIATVAKYGDQSRTSFKKFNSDLALNLVFNSSQDNPTSKLILLLVLCTLEVKQTNEIRDEMHYAPQF